LNEQYEGPEFTLAPRLASLLMIVYVSLMFGAGVPFLFVVVLIDLLFTFWVDKVARTCPSVALL
jgi:hypothetical protein